MRLVLISLLGGFVMIGSSCGMMPKKPTPLMPAVRGYNDGLRWKRIPHAAAYIASAEREAFLDEREDLEEDLRIDEYDIARVRHTGRNKAVVHIKYVWHMDNEGVVHKTTSAQQWERTGGRWMMAEEHRSHGDEMPGVPEPPNPDQGAEETGSKDIDEPGSPEIDSLDPAAESR